jgi:integrase
MRRRKNPLLDLAPVPAGTVTFGTMAQAYLEDYVLQRYRTLGTARARVEHLHGFFGASAAEAMTADSVRTDQFYRRKQGAEAATINRETAALSRMFQLAIRRGLLERMPLFPKRLEENQPRDGFFEHDEYVKVRAQLPRSYQDVLDFAYYSGWRRNEILGLTWNEVDLRGGIIRLLPRRSKTRSSRIPTRKEAKQMSPAATAQARSVSRSPGTTGTAGVSVRAVGERG